MGICVRPKRKLYGIIDLFIITARKRSLGQGIVFTPVCHSVHRGRVSLTENPWIETSPGQRPPGQRPPGQRPPRAVKSGWYSSYWNAFLLDAFFVSQSKLYWSGTFTIRMFCLSIKMKYVSVIFVRLDSGRKVSTRM